VLSGCVRDVPASPRVSSGATALSNWTWQQAVVDRFKKNSAPHCRFSSEFCFVLYLSCYGLDDPGFDS
jgi:hypothetical protein